MGEIVLNAELKSTNSILMSCFFPWYVKTEDSGDVILSGSFGTKSKLMKVQAGWDLIFDVLDNQFLKALH